MPKKLGPAIAPDVHGPGHGFREGWLHNAGAAIPSVDMSTAVKLLPFVLSVTAGSTDVIGFLALDGLFTAHITGNLVMLATKFLAGGPAPIAHLLSVPVFILVLMLTRLLASGLERAGITLLWPLLLLQFLLLSALLVIAFVAGPHADPNTPIMLIAGMLGVSAMADQNALVRISLTGAPSTAVMTTNITLFTMDVGELLLGHDPNRITTARKRSQRTWPAIAGFLVGCGLGAACAAASGLRAAVVPTVSAFIALALGIAASLHQTTPSTSRTENAA